MIVDVLYKGTSIVNGNIVSDHFKNQEKEIVERIKSKKKWNNTIYHKVLKMHFL